MSFVIEESGKVGDVRLEQGSGFGLLDRDAADTIRRAAPFPKPPVKARLVIPVEYILQ